MTRCACLFALALALAPSNGAGAQAGIRVNEMERVRVDGALGDWRGARFTSVGEGADASMRFALGSDARGLYVAAEVWDDRLVRTPSPGASEDAVILTLAGSGRRATSVDVYLFAGVAGRSAASAGTAPVGSARVRPLAGAQVVEGPIARGRGYTIEAFIPFSAVPGGAGGWERARASIRLRDVDREARPEVESEPALVPVDARDLSTLVPLFPAGGGGGALEEFLASRELLASRPTHDLRGDVAGDARPERVFLVAGFLLVTGPGFRDGRYAYHQLPVDEARDVRAAELTDVTGDGKDELLVVLRQRNAQGERDLWQVMSLAGDSPRALFAIEVRKAIGAGSVDARLRVRRSRRGAPTIEVRAGRASGLDAETYREAPATDAEPILVPWGPVLERTYRWNGRTFDRTGERSNPRYTPPSEAPARAATPAPVEQAPAPPSEEALLTAFRRQRRIAANARPRFRARANLAGGPEPETALVYGRQLVVVGPGVQDGASWLFYEIPAPDDADLLALETADVSGDGRAEIVLRMRQSFGEVVREVLLVHQLTGGGFPRLLQVEVARVSGEDSIRNEVRTSGGALEIRPGRATGWSEARWPFTRDASDPVEPLLLPWRDRAVRYQLRGGRLVAR